LPLIRDILFFCAILSIPAAEAGENSSAVRLKTVPALTDARPFSDPVKVILEVSDRGGNAADKARLKLRLHAPDPHWLFSTDFPRVEGTLLSEMVVPVSQARAEWEYVFPIRGVYRLEVELVDEGTAIKKMFELQIKESRLKLLFLGSFIAVLFLFGFVGGRLFTAPRQVRG
jgi:hypothetical protein